MSVRLLRGDYVFKHVADLHDRVARTLPNRQPLAHDIIPHFSITILLAFYDLTNYH